MDDLLCEALETVLKEYGSKGYVFWKEGIGHYSMLELPHPRNNDLVIEVSAMWNEVKPGGAIRVMVSVQDLKPKRFQVRVPSCSFAVLEDGRVDPPLGSQ